MSAIAPSHTLVTQQPLLALTLALTSIHMEISKRDDRKTLIDSGSSGRQPPHTSSTSPNWDQTPKISVELCTALRKYHHQSHRRRSNKSPARIHPCLPQLASACLGPLRCEQTLMTSVSSVSTISTEALRPPQVCDSEPVSENQFQCTVEL